MKVLYALFLIFSAAFVNANEVSTTTTPLGPQCKTNCNSVYGRVLGQSPAGIKAYSNCNADCVVYEPHHYKQIYTGIKWQCVEYARRWLLHEFEVVYGDVDIAADIWALPHVSNPKNKQVYAFKSIVNGADRLPKRGDLLIYSKEFLGTGHVAVVIGVDNEQQIIKVAEQNFDNMIWENAYAREIRYTKSSEKYWLLDAYLIGWKRVEKNNK